MALHFVFVRIGKRPTSDLHAFELQNLLICYMSGAPIWRTPHVVNLQVTWVKTKNYNPGNCVMREALGDDQSLHIMVNNFNPKFNFDSL